MGETLRMDGRLRNLLALDGLAFLVCVAALYGLYRVPLLVSPLALVLLILAAAALLVLDAASWSLTGVRSIELDEEALTLYRGRDLTELRVERGSVRSVRATRRLGRGMVTIWPVCGRPVRIREDPFPSGEFRRFVTVLLRWR